MFKMFMIYWFHMFGNNVNQKMHTFRKKIAH